MSDIVLSLTTIPGRVKYLEAFLRSVERQSMKPLRIELNLPTEYKKRPIGAAERSAIPSDFDVYECDDVGPATKVLPTLRRYEGTGQKIVYCDDDRRFQKNWLKRLYEQSMRMPDCAIADECHTIKAIEYRFKHQKKSLSYRLKRVLSLGAYNPRGKNLGPCCNIAMGCGGVLVTPAFFSHHVFEVPDIIWSVDDVWLSANILATGTKIKWTGRREWQRTRSLRVDLLDVGRQADALSTSSFDGFDRAKADYYAVNYCREHLGVWSD